MTQLSKSIKIIEQGDTASLIYTHPSNATIELQFTVNGMYIDGVAMGESLFGSDPVPVVRTNNPIVGSNDVNENIDALDAAIGVDNTPVARTNNPTVANTALNAKVQALDNAVGADMTPVTRAVGQLAVANSVNTNLDALDTVIGFDNQMSGTKKNLSASLSIYQNLDALDVYKTVRTIKVSIGNVGVTGCTQAAASAANADEQVFTFTNLIPAKARVLDIMTLTTAAFTNLGATTAEIGTTSSGAEFIAHTTIAALNAITASAHAAGFNNLPVLAASNLYVSIKPTQQWDSATPVGKVEIYLTVIDLLNV